MLLPIAYYPVIALSDGTLAENQGIIGNTETIDIISHQEYVSQELIEYRTTQFNGWHWDGKIIYDSENEIIYTSPTVISYAYVTNNAVFYLSENKLYRYHFSSKACDELTSVPETCIEIYPVTNHVVILYMPNPEFDATNDQSEPRILWSYDGLSVQKISPNITERVQQLVDQKLYGNPNADADIQSTNYSITVPVGTYVINGCGLPLSYYQTGTSSSYPQGWFFNLRGATASNANSAGTSPCLNHPYTTECRPYYGCYQCMGFAVYVYEKMYGRDWTSSLEKNTLNTNIQTMTSTQVYNLFSSIPLGSHVRIQAPYAQHSFILLACDANYITYYHANDGTSCHVSIWKQTWSQFNSHYSTLYYYHNPSSSSCQHSYDLTGTKTSTMHQRRCSNCSAISWNNHSRTYSNKTATTHHEACWVCGYAATVSHTWSYGAWSSGQRTVKCSVCKYSYIQYQ